jgi:hypothetical protein
MTHRLTLRIMIIFCSLSVSGLINGNELNAKNIIVFPLQAPHLEQRQLNHQTDLLRKAVRSVKGLSPSSSKRSRRVIRNLKFNLSLLRKPRKAETKIKQLCLKLKIPYALSVMMKLGTDKKPAKLLGSLFFCDHITSRIERFELPFEGKLSKRIWDVFSDVLDEALNRKLATSHYSKSTTAQSRFRSQSSYSLNSRHRISPISPASSSPMRPSTPTVPMTPPTPPPPMMPPPTIGRSKTNHTFTSMETPRFTFMIGGCLLSKSFLYDTAKDTRSLQGGIRYETSWLTGWGLQLAFRPFKSTIDAPSQFSIFGHFERYKYESTRVINNLYSGDQNTVRLVLPSDLSRWQAGFKYNYPIKAGQRTHQTGILVAYHGTLMNIQSNADFLGLDVHQAEIGISGDFVVIPRTFNLTLIGGFRPLIFLGNREKELAMKSDSYGISSRVAFHYRGEDGLSLGVHLNLNFIFIELEGMGRDGRVGKEARDQTISLGFTIGFRSSPVPSDIIE